MRVEASGILVAREDCAEPGCWMEFLSRGERRVFEASWFAVEEASEASKPVSDRDLPL